ncbi:conserved hypothetical protein [Culex quinquefasciatus]|uniref:Uncharacterized protein n=1 Tax=Culex quinquefasciatus TaxID=7176 RepID=B0WFQ5_CULQU|nr:conserved hypothetical protein [Culex quinquefasciatus]|eukprot:XP_001847539.1 conserved hypothetical protein [Culex quinquefasciatus]
MDSRTTKSTTTSYELDDGTAAKTAKDKFLRASSPTFLLPPPSPPPTSLSSAAAGRISPPTLSIDDDYDYVSPPTKAKAALFCDLDLPQHYAKTGSSSVAYHHHLVLEHNRYHQQHHHPHLQLQKPKPDKTGDVDMRDSYCFLRLQRFVARNPVLNYLLPVVVVAVLIFVIYAFRDYAKSILYWIETQNSWIIFGIFLCLFTIVSFPVTVGYLVLIISSGYLFGFIKGLLTVVIGANLGVAIAHNTIKSMQSRLPIHKQ